MLITFLLLLRKEHISFEQFLSTIVDNFCLF